MSTLTFLVLIIVVLVFYGIIKKITTKPITMLCPNCFTKAIPKGKIKGSFAIEIILWLCFIIPGLIYSIWRSGSRYKVCPTCGETGMIPLDSPRAQQLLSGK